MKKLLILALALTAALGLSGCSEHASALAGGTANNANTVLPVNDEDGFEHKLFEGDNIVEHDFVGYCGNTQTTVRRNTQTDGETAKKTFMSSDSVALTDLLWRLDYSGYICKCAPEYFVKTEFGEEEYEISLSKGYARYNGGQVSLTGEQIELIRGIITRQLK